MPSDFNLKNELKNYSREELIEEIARLRIVLVKRNSGAYQKAKKIFLNEKKQFIKKLKDFCFAIGDDNDREGVLDEINNLAGQKLNG